MLLRLGLLPALAAVGALTAASVVAPRASGAACSTTQAVSGSNVILTISTVGSCEWTVPDGLSVADFLIVGGGGGGGGAIQGGSGIMAGGGGGGGQVVVSAARSITPGSSVAVVVGDGGSGGNAAAVSPFAGLGGANGASSSVTIGVTTTTALGGGGGASSKNIVSYPDSWAAKTGGPGGGGSAAAFPYYTGATGSAGTGNGGDGADRNTTGAGAGGGGGASGNGGAGTRDSINDIGIGGAGGSGTTWEGTTYGGGGGGGAGGSPGSAAGAGGTGGGGTGGFERTIFAGPTPTIATDGTDGLGGGGGGGRPCCGSSLSVNSADGMGGSGGRGVVRIKFLGTPPSVTTTAGVSPSSGLLLVGDTATGSAATFAAIPGAAVQAAWYACTLAGVATTSLPADCTVINGETGTSLSVGAGATGRFLRFASQGSNGLGSAVTSFSATSAMVATVPDAPSGVGAVAGDASAAVSWNPPASDGGAAITGYEVTSSPGGYTCAVVAPSTSCTVDGLVNGTAYTFSAVARNAAGVSPGSVPSAPVTPSARTGGASGQGGTSQGGLGPNGSGQDSGDASMPRFSLGRRAVETVQPRSVTIAMRAFVGGPGGLVLNGSEVGPRLTEWGWHGFRESVRTSCVDQVLAPKRGSYILVCTLGARARARVELQGIKVRLTVRFRPRGSASAMTRSKIVAIPRFVSRAPRAAVTG